MEQHPVPQNISSFQFKLIGDITLKQFAYVAGGVILAYIFTKFAFFPWIIRMPLAVITALLGFGLAFVPIEERPMDRWLAAFFKSVYLPTQYVWRKSNPVPEALRDLGATPSPTTTPNPAAVAPQVVPVNLPIIPPLPQPKVKPAPLISKPVEATKVVNVPPEVVPRFIPPTPVKNKMPANWNLGAPPKFNTSKPVAPPTPPITSTRVPVQTTTTTESMQLTKLKTSYQVLEQRLTTQMQAMQEELAKGNVTKERFLELQQTVSQLLNEKERMSNELVQLRKQLSVNPQAQGQVVRPTTYAQPPPSTQVKVIPANMAVRVGIPQLTSYPNTMSGIIKDGDGNTLPNILVTVKDKDQVPVRALKTNKLGQFAASTPLANGTYIIEAEDPKKVFSFQRVEVVLTGKALSPLEVSAISHKDEMRQKLSQEIFGQKTI
ncbi:TPA: hypothetical protein DIV55_05800 [Patescibacteria group bacterium]|uniref:Minus agglutinin n=1 Tax=Candidatus Gottesmanbacteria bacterium GW2011_GWA1_43_11 TaxID=1618436 RepID=A0A0G1CIH9_9BACT|nr:MAG: hypothetical protein UV59_C0006G0046 [Candidatus Gottesmanbacteria bacterium GW2011_GWA1_43_11]HCS79221.1 hypothetical protein [Patescibacteria group bacterium]